jgi:hypothetical protein
VIEAMLKTAKEINEWDDARFRQLQNMVEDCHNFVKQVKDRLEFRACIESFKSHFREMELDDISEEQKIDLIAVYRELDVYRVKKGKDDDKVPTFQKILYSLDRKVRFGDDLSLFQRWPQSEFDKLWLQFVRHGGTRERRVGIRLTFLPHLLQY